MELCKYDLAQYLEPRHRSTPFRPAADGDAKLFATDLEPRLNTKCRSNMPRPSIYSQCQLVHRDLKPQNGYHFGQGAYKIVLQVCSEDNLGRIADFGICSHATSRKLKETSGQRGTGGYRAPEVLNDEDERIPLFKTSQTFGDGLLACR